MKRVISIILAATLLLTLFAGCGAKKGGSSDGAAKTIKIGGIGPVTGDAATYGLAVKYSAELAVEEINAAGGINGVKIEFQFQDDEHDAQKSVNAYNTLKDWGMQLLMGTVTSVPCTAVSKEAEADNMFLLAPSASSVESIQPANAFRVCFSDPNQGIASADYIADNNLAKKVAVIYNSSDSYSTGIYEKFTAQAKVKGIEVVEAQSFTNDNATDFSAQIQKVKESGAELVFLPIYYTPVSLILKQAQKVGLNVKYFGCDGLDGLLSVEKFDTKLAEDVMLLTPFAADSKDEATQKFVTAFNAKYDPQYLNQFGADAYDAMYIIKAACEKAGVSADMSASDICDALVKVMTEIKVDGVTGEGITWDASGEPTKAPKAVVIKDGSYVAM